MHRVRMAGEEDDDEKEAYSPMGILITGAAGFVASHVTNRLICNYPHYKIIGLDKLDYCSNVKNLLSSPNFKFVKGDIACQDLVNHLLESEEIDTVMHFAAQTQIDNSFTNSIDFTNNNIYGTHVLLEACKLSQRIKRFIHVSTDEVYGETDLETDIGSPEASQLLPTNPYSATKAGAEMLAMAYHRCYDLPTITTRGNNAYGPNQYPEKLIPKFILLAMKGEKLPIHGNGYNFRSYLYCEDVAEAFDVILHRGVIGNVYNIGTQKERRVLDVAEDVCRLFGLDPEKTITFVQDRPFNDQRYLLDDQKLKKLGWREKTQWEEGMKRTMEWYTRNPGWWGDVSAALDPYSRFFGDDSCWLTRRSYSEVRRWSETKFLIYGRTALIGGFLGKICREEGIVYEYGRGRLEDRRSLMEDLRRSRPSHVFNAAGVSDECQLQKVEMIRRNVIGSVSLADVCREQGVLMVNFTTGFTFDCDAEEEDSSPFVTAPFYSKAMAMAEELLEEYENVCVLRVGLPISSDEENRRNLMRKIRRYKEGEAVRMTVLDELLPVAMEMAKREWRGAWNLSNPGGIRQDEVGELYRKYIDPEFKWQTFDLEEGTRKATTRVEPQEMGASTLKREFPQLLPIKDSLIKYVFKPNTKA